MDDKHVTYNSLSPGQAICSVSIGSRCSRGHADQYKVLTGAEFGAN